MSARKIDFYLNSSDRLRSLTRDARQLAELQQVLKNTAPSALLIQMSERNQVSKMLFQRISADTRQFDDIADRDTPMLPGKFHNL